MPPPLRHPSKLGAVVTTRGSIVLKSICKALRTSGDPAVANDKKRAFEDLLAIRDAAAEETTRMGAPQAMNRAADRLKGGNEAEAGGVVAVNNEFRARVKYSENGDGIEIEGPRRSSERRAKRDLELRLKKSYLKLTKG